MHAELASLNHCAVPFIKPRRRQLVLVLHYTKPRSVRWCDISSCKFSNPRNKKREQVKKQIF